MGSQLQNFIAESKKQQDVLPYLSVSRDIETAPTAYAVVAMEFASGEVGFLMWRIVVNRLIDHSEDTQISKPMGTHVQSI